MIGGSGDGDPVWNPRRWQNHARVRHRRCDSNLGRGRIWRRGGALCAGPSRRIVLDVNSNARSRQVAATPRHRGRLCDDGIVRAGGSTRACRARSVWRHFEPALKRFRKDGFALAPIIARAPMGKNSCGGRRRHLFTTGTTRSTASHSRRYRQRSPITNHPARQFKSANSLSRSVGPSGNRVRNALSCQRRASVPFATGLAGFRRCGRHSLHSRRGRRTVRRP